MPLLGFHRNESYYAEQFLPFGLRTAPYLSNLFAEVFHWILEKERTRKGPQIQVIHYLDDFLLVSSPTTAPEQCSQTFKLLCEEVGLAIKDAKNEQGSITSFAGIEIDTRSMVIRLLEKKLQKAKSLVRGAIAQKSATLLELQQITGYLNFVSSVVRLGQTFFRRLYNMEVYFPPGAGAAYQAKPTRTWYGGRRYALERLSDRSLSKYDKQFPSGLTPQALKASVPFTPATASPNLNHTVHLPFPYPQTRV